VANLSRERADKYDVDLEFTVPDVGAVSDAVSTIAEQDTLELDSAYYDTADLDLLRSGATLHRRRGAVDAGWQLKLPDHEARMELAVPPRDGTVPKELRDLVVGVRLGRPLKRVVMLRISRNVQRLLTGDDRVLAVISDDTVRASTLDGVAMPTEWREIEVELGEAGDEALLAAIGACLVRDGAVPSPIRSKLTRALGLSVAQEDTVSDDATAGGVVMSYLAAQQATLLTADVALRAGQDAAPAARAATRRLRCTLRVFGSMFDAERARTLGAELSWLESLLGDVADCETLRARLAAAVADLPGELVVGPVARRIETRLRAEREAYQTALSRAMRGRRYLALLDELSGWTSAPPVTDAAAEPADAVVRCVRAAERVLAKRLRAAGSEDATDADLRRAGIAAERARYAAELAGVLLGQRRARKHIERNADLQRLIGRHQDAVRTAQFLRELARSGGEGGFTIGVLYELEMQRARRARARAQRATGRG
jgi:CHAD domain-containing protein